ncbi:ZZ-type zinc finger-containing protein 3-like isoform X1 [Dysidea avara]|uniref:ZZ-type zinc finger-containing protein 3-like isoform X1 n=1 Tax=Dysidea avara TaxID=196820 RepID=UPI0033193444
MDEELEAYVNKREDSQVGQGVDGDHLYSQDSSHSSGTTQLHDVTTQSLVSQTSWASSAADSIHDDDQPQENHRRFVLESDHLALKNNGDYQLMLKTLATLEAQRMKVLQDIDILISRKRQALKNPESFFESLMNGTSDPLPTRQEVATIPDINLTKYTKGLKLNSKLLHHKYGTRQKAENRHFQTLEDPNLDPTDKVRGKVANELKTRTFNQLWTAEEQTKLEHLLEVYPPEDIESRRFEKIAAALGNRTVKQVQSRVQKYFIKLAKAGLPVPGRKPSVALLTNKSKIKRKEKLPKSKLSTFFSSLEPKVYMDDEEDDEQSGDEESSPSEDEDTEGTRQPYVDEDYMDFRSNEEAVGYNYLDPNFCPAT